MIKGILSGIAGLLLAGSVLASGERLDANEVMVVGRDNCNKVSMIFMMSEKGPYRVIPVEKIEKRGGEVNRDILEDRIDEFEGIVVEVRSERGECINL